MWRLALFLVSTLLFGSVLANDEAEEGRSINQPGNQEARSCQECHGGSGVHPAGYSEVHVSAADKIFDPTNLLGLGGMALSMLPLLAINLAGLILLAILLKHLLYKEEEPAYYAHAPTYGSYQSYDTGSSSYSKRSFDEDSPSGLQYLTNLVNNAIDQYAQTEVE